MSICALGVVGRAGVVHPGPVGQHDLHDARDVVHLEIAQEARHLEWRALREAARQAVMASFRIDVKRFLDRRPALAPRLSLWTSMGLGGSSFSSFSPAKRPWKRLVRGLRGGSQAHPPHLFSSQDPFSCLIQRLLLRLIRHRQQQIDDLLLRNGEGHPLATVLLPFPSFRSVATEPRRPAWACTPPWR